jgi:Dolichyl-phosphate-mannose-protein mannosyltransferase
MAPADAVAQSMRPFVSVRSLLVVVSLASLLYLLGLLYYAQVRPLDGDEGYYTTAARLVWEGKVPYKDFAYQQGILLPYIYSWIWSVHPRSLVAMRFLSAACGAIAVLLWGLWLVSSRRFSPTVALATFAVILLNPYWVWWNIAVKTFAVSNLLVSVTMICLYFALQSQGPRWYFTAGLALGACASARGLYAPLVPLVLAWLLQVEWRARSRRFAGSAAFLPGAACGVLPMILSFASDPHAFIFNNVSYRSLLSPHETFRRSVHVYLDNLASLLHHTYFVVTILLALAGIFSLLKLRRRPELPYNRQDYRYFQLAILMLGVYVATASIPFPVYDQYFSSPLLPFLVFFIAEGLRVSLRFRTLTLFLLVVILPILFLRGIKGESEEYAFTRNLQLASFRQIKQVLESNSRPDDVVLSIWPGYVFESGRRYFPGSENQFSYDVASKISPDARARYHLLSGAEVINAISSHDFDIFISSANRYYLDATMSPIERQRMRDALNSNYALVGKYDGVEIYRRR